MYRKMKSGAARIAGILIYLPFDELQTTGAIGVLGPEEPWECIRQSAATANCCGHVHALDQWHSLYNKNGSSTVCPRKHLLRMTKVNKGLYPLSSAVAQHGKCLKLLSDEQHFQNYIPWWVAFVETDINLHSWKKKKQNNPKQLNLEK